MVIQDDRSSPWNCVCVFKVFNKREMNFPCVEKKKTTGERISSGHSGSFFVKVYKSTPSLLGNNFNLWYFDIFYRTRINLGSFYYEDSTGYMNGNKVDGYFGRTTMLVLIKSRPPSSSAEIHFFVSGASPPPKDVIIFVVCCVVAYLFFN